MQKKTDRFVHDGKNRFEREAYKNFLRSHFPLDKTEEDPPDTSNTDISSVENEEVTQPPVRKKSLKLRFMDFCRSNIGVAIVGGLLVAVVIGGLSFYVTTKSDISIAYEKIENVEEDVSEIKELTKENADKANELKSALEVFKAEIQKDIEYLKNLMKL